MSSLNILLKRLKQEKNKCYNNNALANQSPKKPLRCLCRSTNNSLVTVTKLFVRYEYQKLCT